MADLMPNKIENQIPLKRIIKQNQKKKIAISKLADAAKKLVWPSLVFNLSNEFAFKFSLCVFGDKSSDAKARTSMLLETQVIYLETDKERFELAKQKNGEKMLYTMSKVLKPEDKDNTMMSLE